MGKINDECGVFGMYSKTTKPLARLTYYGLFALQHRGQESAGIVVNDEGVFRFYRELGLVSEAMTKEQLDRLGDGQMSCGALLHLRHHKPYQCAADRRKSCEGTYGTLS